ncbi:chloroplast lipoate protein ligase [Daedaleopsis nitida]|nr:chloroplast lipoate protein ligase [Daedaleopsis nitida]
MGLPPIFYHCFKTPLPYSTALSLQERIHALQSFSRKASRSHRDYLLLLEHRPVYTFGRRQTEASEEVALEALRLRGLGADCISTQRGGQTTYHGPGQIVGYPLLDLGRTTPPMSIREYICRLQKTVEVQLTEGHGIQYIPSEHTGVFLDQRTKIASIGVQVRHRLTTHGFALNVTEEPLPWFNRVVACGLSDVKPGCIAKAAAQQSGRADISVASEVPSLISRFGRVFERNMVALDASAEGEVEDAIRATEREAIESGAWPLAPSS